jgi:hypothetical protein
MSPPTGEDVAAAMGEFPADTQRAIAAYQSANPNRMRQWAAHHAGSESLSDSQRAAVLTIGSAPKTALENGIGQAMKVVDTQASEAPPATGPDQPSPARTPGASEQPSSRNLGSALEQPPSPPSGRDLSRDLPDPEPFIE